MIRNIFVLCFLSLITLAGCFKDVREDSNNTLTVGITPNRPPFETIDDNENVSGISVDMAKDLGEYLGKTVKFIPLHWAELIPNVRNNKCDIILSSMAITPDRAKLIQFSESYGEFSVNVVSNTSFSFQSISELNDSKVRIAVYKGTIYEQFAKEYFPKAHLLVSRSMEEAYERVLYNNADISLVSTLQALEVVKNHPNELMFHADAVGEVYIGVGVKKGLKNYFFLLKKINNFLRYYRKEGKMDNLVQKYLSEYRDIYKENNLPFYLIYTKSYEDLH